MAYLIVFGVLWLVCVGLGIFIRVSIPTTVQPTGNDLTGILIWSTAAAFTALVVVAGFVAIISAMFGA